MDVEMFQKIRWGDFMIETGFKKVKVFLMSRKMSKINRKLSDFKWCKCKLMQEEKNQYEELYKANFGHANQD